MWEDVNCSICGSEEKKIITKVRFSPLGGISNLVECKRCGLNYVSPRYIIKKEKEFYIQRYYELDSDDLWQKNRQPLFRLYLDKINRLYPKRGNLLDVGCGKGFFLKLAQEDGWKVFGTDISKSAIKYGKEILGLNILECELADARFERSYFDVVTLFNVLDQIYNPLETLKEVSGLIKPNGLLVLRLVNINFHLFIHYIYNRFLKKDNLKSPTQEPTVFHIYMFSPKIIKRLLKENGFNRIKVLNSPPDPTLVSIGVYFNRRLAHIFRPIIYLFMQIVFWITQGRCVWGSSMLVFARKS